jgi:hypothetical protein
MRVRSCSNVHAMERPCPGLLRIRSRWPLAADPPGPRQLAAEYDAALAEARADAAEAVAAASGRAAAAEAEAQHLREDVAGLRSQLNAAVTRSAAGVAAQALVSSDPATTASAASVVAGGIKAASMGTMRQPAPTSLVPVARNSPRQRPTSTPTPLLPTRSGGAGLGAGVDALAARLLPDELTRCAARPPA